MTDLLGQTIANRRIEAPLGSGDLGQVFRARHVDLGREEAIKIVHANVAAGAGFAERFEREMGAISALSHPNIIQIFDIGYEQGHCYLAMELMPEGSLHTFMQRRARAEEGWPLAFGLDMIRQAADGLACAHAANIVHHNIKPDNLLLTREGAATAGISGYTLKISDFGLTPVTDEEATPAPGMNMGAPAYLSPEQCQGLDLDGRSDLYALGIVLYEVATGFLPFEIKSLNDAVYKHVYATPTAPRQVRPDLPAELETVILRCLAKKPEERFATADELSHALQGLVNTLYAPTPQPIPVPSPVPGTTSPVRVPTPVVVGSSGMNELPPPPPVPQPPLGSTSPSFSTTPSRPPTPQPLPPPVNGAATMPRVQALNQQGQTLQVQELTGDGLTVGRLADNDVALNADAVDDRHVQIDWDGNQATIVDLGSKSGTLLQGQRLAPMKPQPWGWRTMLQVGPYWLQLEPPVAPPVPPPPTAAPIVPAGGRFISPALSPVNGPISQPPAGATPSRRTNESLRSRLKTDRIGVVPDHDTLTITPGQPAVFALTLANLGTLVDHLTVTVEGVPASWIAGPPTTVQLNPGDQTLVALNVSVPRVPESRAGEYPVVIRARSRENQSESGTARGQWTVLPFTGSTLTIRPKRSKGWRKGKHIVALSNDGNAPAHYSLSGDDDEQALAYDFAEDQVALEPGRAAKVKLAVRGQSHIFGRAVQQSFNVNSLPENSTTTQVVGAQFVQRALIAPWAIPVGIFALIGLAALLFLLTRTSIAHFNSDQPRPLVAGKTAVVQWEVLHGPTMELLRNGQPVEITPASSGVYTFTVESEGTTTLELKASNRFGGQASTALSLPFITLTPIPPTLTPTVEPSLPPPPPPPPPSDTPTESPVPTNTAVPTPSNTSTATITPTPTDQLACANVNTNPVAISGVGPPNTPVLLYVSKLRDKNGPPEYEQVVGGTTTDSRGRFSIPLEMRGQRPAYYKVTVRERYTGQEIRQFNCDIPATAVPTAAITGTPATPTK